MEMPPRSVYLMALVSRVVDHLAQARRIGVDALAQLGAGLPVHVEVALGQRLLDVAQRGIDELVELEAADARLEAAGGHLGEVDQVADATTQRARAFLQARERRVGRVDPAARLDHVHRAPDGLQRGEQLVAEHAQEARLVAPHRLGARPLHLGDIGQMLGTPADGALAPRDQHPLRGERRHQHQHRHDHAERDQHLVAHVLDLVEEHRRHRLALPRLLPDAHEAVERRLCLRAGARPIGRAALRLLQAVRQGCHRVRPRRPLRQQQRARLGDLRAQRVATQHEAQGIGLQPLAGRRRARRWPDPI